MLKNLGVEPLIDPTARVNDCALGRYTEVGARTSIIETCVGDYSYVVNDREIVHTTIGRFCSIAAMARINPGNHPMCRATQSHFTYRARAYFEGEKDESEFFERRRTTPLHIDHEVWIGHGAIFLPGRRNGNGAIISAGAVITHDVPRFAIVGGTPTWILKWRFPDHVVEALEALFWWDWPHEMLHTALDGLRTFCAAVFVKKYARISVRRAIVGHREKHLELDGAA